MIHLSRVPGHGTNGVEKTVMSKNSLREVTGVPTVTLSLAISFVDLA